MSVIIATTRVACQIAGGNQDITAADLGGITPKAARFIVVRATADGTPADHASICYGAATGTEEQWVVAMSSEHGAGATNVYRRATDDECVMILDPTDGSIDGEAAFAAFINNGVRIT